MECAGWFVEGRACRTAVGSNNSPPAWAYEKGDGVRRDMKEAALLYLLAAEQGQANAQTNLGWAYTRGEGVPKDKKEAECTGHTEYSTLERYVKLRPSVLAAKMD